MKIEYENSFKKQYLKCIKRGYDQEALRELLGYFVNDIKLPKKYCDHQLVDSKKYKRVRECHIKPDWLLIYKVNKKESVITLIATGSHSDLY